MRKKLHHFFWQYHYRHSHRLQQMIHTMYGTSRKQNLAISHPLNYGYGATMPEGNGSKPKQHHNGCHLQTR